jgi:hypothetical protein
VAYVKRIVCLANSYKRRGRCIPGREILANGYGGWVRPVSERPKAEVALSECRYENNVIPKLLDVVDVPLLSAVRTIRRLKITFSTQRPRGRGKVCSHGMSWSSFAIVRLPVGSTAFAPRLGLMIASVRKKHPPSRTPSCSSRRRFHCGGWLKNLGRRKVKDLQRKFQVQWHLLQLERYRSCRQRCICTKR